jgi:hypothetical protein
VTLDLFQFDFGIETWAQTLQNVFHWRSSE